MNTTSMNSGRPAGMRPLTDEELEAQAIRELEALGRKLNAKRSDYTPKRRGQYADHR